MANTCAFCVVALGECVLDKSTDVVCCFASQEDDCLIKRRQSVSGCHRRVGSGAVTVVFGPRYAYQCHIGQRNGLANPYRVAGQLELPVIRCESRKADVTSNITLASLPSLGRHRFGGGRGSAKTTPTTAKRRGERAVNSICSCSLETTTASTILLFTVRKSKYLRLQVVQKHVRQRTWRADKRARPRRCTGGMVGTASLMLRRLCDRC